MLLVIILYIIGCILDTILCIYYFIEEYNEVTLSDLMVSILTALFSWIAIVPILFFCYGDIIIYRKHGSNR